ARAGVGSLAVRYRSLVERTLRGHMSVVGDCLLQIGGSRRQDGDRETRGRSRGILPVVEGDVARSAPRRRDRAGPRTIDVVRDPHLARSAELAEPADQEIAGLN